MPHPRLHKVKTSTQYRHLPQLGVTMFILGERPSIKFKALQFFARRMQNNCLLNLETVGLTLAWALEPHKYNALLLFPLATRWRGSTELAGGGGNGIHGKLMESNRPNGAHRHVATNNQPTKNIFNYWPVLLFRSGSKNHRKHVRLGN